MTASDIELTARISELERDLDAVLAERAELEARLRPFAETYEAFIAYLPLLIFGRDFHLFLCVKRTPEETEAMYLAAADTLRGGDL